MNWKQAKRIMTVMLAALNIVLFVVNRYYNNDYRLTQDEENAAYRILAENGIGIYTNFITEYKPMRQLDVTVSDPDIDELKSIFFDADDAVDVTADIEKTVMHSYSAELTVENSKISYVSNTGIGEINVLGNSAAQSLASDFIHKMGDKYSAYVLDRVIYKNGGYQLEYYEYYKGYKIFNNYCIFFIDENGIRSIESEDYDINGFAESSEDIYSSAEAVLTYIYENKNESNAGKFIEEMEIGYDFKDTDEIVDGSKMRLVPCYRIYLLNEDEPFTIYAYTNKAKVNTDMAQPLQGMSVLDESAVQ